MILGIVLLFLILNCFFGSIPQNQLWYLNTGILVALLFLGKNEPSKYKQPFMLLAFGLLCSMVSCYIHRGQGLIDSIKACYNILGITFYFFLKWKKVTLTHIEKSLVFLVVVYDVLYILQYYLIDYGINFLGIDDWMLDDGSDLGGNRLRVMSSGLYLLGIFYGISKWCDSKKHSYLLLFFFGVFIMLLSGYRQFVLSLIICLLFMAYKYGVRFNAKVAFTSILFILFLFLIIQLPVVQEKILGMVNRNDSGATLDNDDYIRVVQFAYFNDSFFINKWEHFFGSGLPWGASSYGRQMIDLSEQGIQYADWGMIGFSWIAGVLSAIAFIWLSLKAIFMKVEKKYMYVSIWYIFLLLSSITNWEFFRNGNFLVHAIALYIVEIANNKYTYQQCVKK